MKATRVAVLAASAALMLPILWPIISGNPPTGDDLGWFHRPIRAFYARCLADGDSPLWHPGLFCGFYIHGEGQAGMDHSLHRALYLWLPWNRAFAVEVAIGYPLLFAGMIAWLRRTGVRTEAAVIGAISLTFSGFMLFRYVHTNAVQVIAHLPWVLLAVEVIASGKRPLLGGVALALLTASQGLLGYPQYLGFSLLISTSYLACRVGRFAAGERPTALGITDAARSVLLYSSAISLGLITASAQILPQLDALTNSTRAQPTQAFLGKGSLHPLNLIQLVLPFAFSKGFYDPDRVAAWPRHESVAYLGTIIPALLSWLWIRRGELRRYRTFIAWAAILGIGALTLALGHHSPLFSAYARLPGASIFRYPSRYIVISQFAASVLAAVALGDLLRVCRKGTCIPWRSLWSMVVPIALSVFAAIALLIVRWLHLDGFRTESIATTADLARSVAWLAAPCVLVILAARGRRLAPAILIVLAASDSFAFALAPIIHHELHARRPEPIAIGPGRSLTPRNESLTEGGHLVRGYVALTPRRRLDYHKDSALRLAGAVRRLDDSGLWSSLATTALPRARLVSRAIVSSAPNDDIDRIDLDSTALVEAPIDLSPGELGTASITRDRPGQVVVTTNASARRLIVLSESFHTGWRAAVDGRPATPIRVNGDFLGVVVESGHHAVVLQFAPASVQTGRAASIAGFLAIALVSLYAVGKRTRPPSQSARSRHVLCSSGGRL